MNKLGSKEIFLILVIGNLLLYYLAYVCVISPIRNKGKEYSDEMAMVQAEYDEKKQTVDSIPQLEEDIKNLQSNKDEKLAASYPKGYAEDVQMFMTKQIEARSLTMTDVPTIKQNAITQKDADGEDVPTKISNNTISVNVSGTYKNAMDFLNEMETRNKGAKLTSLSLNVEGADSYKVEAEYLMLTVDKGDDKDNTFSKNTTAFTPKGNDSTIK
jgi:Tfp pilus assembly protein PilO